jgi:hypothetical protein
VSWTELEFIPFLKMQFKWHGDTGLWAQKPSSYINRLLPSQAGKVAQRLGQGWEELAKGLTRLSLRATWLLDLHSWSRIFLNAHVGM